MSILDRLLSVLGLDGADDRGDREPTVTVEHDPDVTDEAAVKGVDTGDGAGSAESDGPDVTGGEESGDADPDAAAESGADVDAPAEPTDVPAEASPGTEPEPEADAESATEADAESEPEADAESEPEADAETEPETEASAESEPEADAESEPETGADEADAATPPIAEAGGEEAADPHAAEGAAESVDSVKGIGPAYADRLTDAGVETIGDLAAADAADLADRISLSEKRVSRWVDRARTRLDLE